MSTRVLIVDDDHDELQVASRVLVKEGHIVAAADSARTALEMLATERADVIVSDVDMPGMGGLEFMREVRARFGTQLVVMMSGLGSVEIAVEAVQEGAIDFLTKPIDFDRLRSTVSRALAAKGHSTELALSMPTVTAQPNLVGEGPLMHSLRRLIHQVAPSDCRVLIQGENGTGKELIANAIHAGSRRRNNPFVKVNCGALTSTLLESELFGHEKGAFTGATTRRRGRFEVAHTGTLLLDEIGELSLDAQVRLLRVIQEGEFERVGGSQTLRCDVRILAATNQDLAEMVTRGKFREDLYYRLNVVTIEAPALRNRRSDIPLLVDHILGGLGAQNRIKFSQGAMDRLMARSYPGNVRELQNIVERLSVLLPGEEILPQHLDELVPSPLSGQLAGPPLLLSSPASYQPGVSYRDRLLQLERDLIVQALEAHGGSKSAAAQALGTDKSFFYRKCRQFGVN